MKSKSSQKGFTLIEMMVVIAILAIFTAISLVDYRSFGKKQEFVNLMYDTALDIRQVQASGISVQETLPGSNEFNVAYGIHIIPSQKNNSYLIFADKVNGGLTFRDNTYTSSNDISIAEHTLPNGYTIYDVCGVTNLVETCTSSSNGYMDILFARPNPDAIISINGSLASIEAGTQHYYEAAKIIIRSPQGESRYIYIDASGQISVR